MKKSLFVHSRPKKRGIDLEDTDRPLSINYSKLRALARSSLLIILVLLFLSRAWAGIAIKSEVDKKSVTTDDLITYKVTITSTEKDSPQLELPRFDGFKVVSTAQSSTVSFLKNALETHFSYVFILAPLEPGKLKLGPVQIKAKSSLFSTEVYEIEVKPGSKPLLPPKEDSLPESQTEEEQEKVTL